jgi:hypothetical protein
MARLLIGVLVLCLSACGGNEGSSTADRIVAKALADIEPFHVVKLDTETVAAAVRAGTIVRLPFVTQENQLTAADVQLALRNIRNPALTHAIVKNGVDKAFRIIPLPPPATFQGMVKGKPGVAVFTINERVVEGNILTAPDGWSIIEPLEPQLCLPSRTAMTLFTEPIRRTRSCRSG